MFKEYDHLRRLLQPLVEQLPCTHASLPKVCNDLSLPEPDSEGTKRDRLRMSMAATQDASLPEVARRLLLQHPPPSAIRNQLEDVLWSDGVCPPIPKRYRREVARRIEAEELYVDRDKFDELLERLWVLGDELWTDALFGRPTGLRAEIHQHVYRHPEDWSAEKLFDKLGAYECSDTRFALFLEGLASADVRIDEAAQRRFVARVNEPLRNCGVELREMRTDGGYPVFAIVTLRTATRGPPKNLIFASAQKPDLRFRDAIDNDVEIVTNADKVLIYDRPIGNDGLKWKDLQVWWGETNQLTDPNEAKRSLYHRLMTCLPDNSPPQKLLFVAYFEAFGTRIPQLPALLPEVWLHWDPRTVTDRGKDALLRFRMDFLLLLPHGVRVVVEVDGKHHYANSAGLADGQLYARMVKADRELKLAGYEVFRFGAAELQTPTAKADVKRFFKALFLRYGVQIP
jgi:hypothetical protein